MCVSSWCRNWQLVNSLYCEFDVPPSLPCCKEWWSAGARRLSQDHQWQVSLPFYDLNQLLTNEFLCKCAALYLSVNVFGTKALILCLLLETGPPFYVFIPASPRSSHLQGQRQNLHFSVILRPWVLLQSRESNPWPPSLQSSTLPTELILSRWIGVIIVVVRSVYEITHWCYLATVSFMREHCSAFSLSNQAWDQPLLPLSSPKTYNLFTSYL